MAIIFSPGQVVAQPDWEALVRQHGGDKPAVRRSRTEAEIKAAALAGEDDPAAMQNPIYRSYMEDGSYVEYRAAPNGTDYQIVDYKPSTTFTQAETKRAAADPAQQTPAQQNETVLNQQRAKNAALPGPNPQGATEEERRGQDPRYETDQERAARADATIKAQGAEAAKPRPQDVAQPGVTQTTDAQGRTVKRTIYQRPDGSTYPVEDVIQAAPPKPEQVSAPSDQMWTVERQPDGTYKQVKNVNYVKPSRIMPDPGDPTKLINVTHDDQGNVIALPVTGTTVIKPADLPVLQAKYGQIAQGLGALAQDLNSRYARGEITEKQKNDAFTAAHQQAQTQVSEINQILDTSKSIWSGELTQRGQSLGETQSRRGFAQNIFDRSVATGLAVGESAGPGHGKAIAAGVGALMRMGQRYAEGMGGFRESPEVALPAALQQARGIGIPGYEDLGVPPGAPSGPNSGPPGAPPGPPTPGASGVPSVMAPGSATGGAPASGTEVTLPALPGAPSERTLPGMPGAGSEVPLRGGLSGQGPSFGTLQQMLQGAEAFGGSPVAAGGLGVYDPTQDVQGMLGDGADPTWAEAVRRAAAEVTQPGYAWQRFQQPTSRFG